MTLQERPEFNGILFQTMSRNSLPSKLKRDVIWAMSSIIGKSFGPDNQMTLLCTSTGKVLTTCDGMTILESLHLSHPVAKLTIESLKRHHRFTGDGTKTFLHFLSQALTDMNKLERNSSPMCFQNLDSAPDSFWNGISMQFARIERDMLPHIWKELCTKSGVKTADTFSWEDLKSVITTVLSSQLTRKDSCLFESTILQTLMSTCCKERATITISSIQKKIKFMVENFNFMHFKLSKHLVDSSFALSGFLLRRDFAVKLPMSGETSNLRFVMLCCSIEGSTSENPDETVSLQDQNSVYKALSLRMVNAQTYLNVLKGCEVCLILCTEKVPDFVLSACRDLNISVVSCVYEEDVQFLERITGTHAITSPFDSVDRLHIGELSGCERKVLGTQRFVHLQFLEKDTYNIPETIVIAAPTDGMVDQITSVVYKSFKSLQMCFAFHDSSRYSMSSRTKDSLFQFHAQEDHLPDTEFTAVGGGGFFEIQTAHLLKKLSSNFSNSDTGLGCKILHDCLLSVPRSLHRHLSRNSATETRDYVQKLLIMEESVNQGGCVGLDRRGRVCNPVETGILEPLVSKISVFASVVQLLQQLIRIDSVVSVRKLDKSESDSD